VSKVGLRLAEPIGVAIAHYVHSFRPLKHNTANYNTVP